MEILDSFKRLACLCGKESVTVNQRKFIIRDKIGEGGFASIELVEEKGSRRLFALKRITCHCASDEEFVLKEAAYMKELHHPNLVSLETSTLLSCDNHDNISMATSVVLIVMPYYKGGSLADEIERLKDRDEGMDENCIFWILQGICRGLNYLHTLKPVALAHRDIKPHNVMFTTFPNHSHPHPHPILVDFGSMGPAVCDIKDSRVANKLQDMAAEKCSMPYRCPELFQVEVGSVVDAKVDVWSLGCLLHAMCYYESPFDRIHQRGDSVALAVMAANVNIPPKYSKLVYSNHVTDMMKSMIQTDPSLRPSIHHLLQSIPQYNNNRNNNNNINNNNNNNTNNNNNNNNHVNMVNNDRIMMDFNNKNNKMLKNNDRRVDDDDDDVLL